MVEGHGPDLWPDLRVAAAVLEPPEQRLQAVVLVVALARPGPRPREVAVQWWICYCLLLEFVSGQWQWVVSQSEERWRQGESIAKGWYKIQRARLVGRAVHWVRKEHRRQKIRLLELLFVKLLAPAPFESAGRVDFPADGSNDEKD